LINFEVSSKKNERKKIITITTFFGWTGDLGLSKGQSRLGVN